MANYLVTDTDLTAVANAIRAKAGTSGGLVFPLAFVDTIAGLQTGDGCNATAGDILAGKTAVVDKQVVTGSIPSKSAEQYTPGTADQLIAAGKYLSGDQTVKGDANLMAGNIRDGKSIFGVAGSFSHEATNPIAANGVLYGKVGYVNGEKVTGSIQSLGATLYNTSSSDQEINAGQYLSGKQTIKGVTTSGISAANIKKGVTIKVGDTNDDDRIATATGTFIGEVYYAKTVKEGTATFNPNVAVYHDTIVLTRTVTGSYFFLGKAEITSSYGLSGITSVFLSSPTDNTLSISIERGNTADASQCSFRVEVYEVYPKQSY